MSDDYDCDDNDDDHYTIKRIRTRPQQNIE